MSKAQMTECCLFFYNSDVAILQDLCVEYATVFPRILPNFFPWLNPFCIAIHFLVLVFCVKGTHEFQKDSNATFCRIAVWNCLTGFGSIPHFFLLADFFHLPLSHGLAPLALRRCSVRKAQMLSSAAAILQDLCVKEVFFCHASSRFPTEKPFPSPFTPFTLPFHTAFNVLNTCLASHWVASLRRGVRVMQSAPLYTLSVT